MDAWLILVLLSLKCTFHLYRVEGSMLSKGCGENCYFYLSYGIAVIQWIMSCHKNRMTTRVMTLRHEYVTSLTTSVSAMRFFIEIMIIVKANTF